MDLDQIIKEEGLIEIIDLAEEIVEVLIGIESGGQEFNEEVDDLIKRNVHSIKGSFGMIGFVEEMDSVHHFETFYFQMVQNREVEASIGCLIDFWQKTLHYLEDMNQKSFLINSLECINCFQKNGEAPCKKSVAEKNQQDDFSRHISEHIRENEYQQCELIAVGSDTKIINLVKKSKCSFMSFECINDIYKHCTKLPNVKVLIIDCNNIEFNTILLQKVCSSLKKNIQFVYVISSKKQINLMLKDVDQISFSFFILSREDKFFEKNLLEFIRLQIW